MKKLTKEIAQEKIKKRHEHLTLTEFNGRNELAKFIDSEYGEFEGIYKYVFDGSKGHHERSLNNKRIALSSDKVKNKRKKTNLDRYGGHPQQTKEVRDKVKQTCLEKYGTESAIASKEVQDKIKETNLDRYGVKNVFELQEIQDNIKQSNLKKYGVENVFSSEKIKEKIKTTNLKKYGVENPSKNEEIKEKIKNTCVEKYGVEYACQSEEVKEKIKNTFVEKYGVNHIMKIDSIAKKANVKSTQTKVNNGTYFNLQGVSLNKFIKDFDIKGSYSAAIKNYKLLGIDGVIFQKEYVSNIEYIISDLLKYHNINYINNKGLLSSRLKPDFIINNKQLIIECDGLYWHSEGSPREEMLNNKKWHKERQEKYTELGYKSLFFREDEILNKTSIVESIILAKLGRYNDRIFARKTKIIGLDSKTASQFFESNHLMGRGSGQCYALTYEDKIVSAIRIIKKKDYIEVSRFCSALNTNVVGGLGKLLKHVIREHNPQKIVSFVDMRYGDGHSLEKLGFVEKTNNVSFKWTDFKQTFHRLNFKGNSGYEKGMFKIWDCGQKKFELDLAL